MGRKELVLINLAPASSPCLLTGLFALVLPSRCAPSLQVELVLLASFSCCCLRVGGAGASGPACWRRARCWGAGAWWQCARRDLGRLQCTEIETSNEAHGHEMSEV